MSATRPTSPRDWARGLPISVAISRASSSRRSRYSSATRAITFARASTGADCQSRKAAFESASACSTSAAVASGNSFNVSPVAGFTVL